MSFAKAGRWGPDNFTDRRGRPLEQPAVEVRDSSGAVAVLYVDAAKSSTLANPLPVDVSTGVPGVDRLGNVMFFADPGLYVLQVNASAYPVSIDADPSEQGGGGGGGGGLPVGGASGQVLRKQSSTDGDATWATPDVTQTELDAEATARAAAVAAEITARSNADALLIPQTDKGIPLGVAPLGADGKVPPDLVSSYVKAEFLGFVGSQPLMLGLSGGPADWCIRTDTTVGGVVTPTEWVLLAQDASQFANWQQMPQYVGVTSVNGQTGAVIGKAEQTALDAETARAIAAEASKETPAGAQTKADAAQAYAIARGHHTGTQLAATISDLVAVVTALRLDQFAAPTAPVSFGGQRGTNFLDPVGAQDAATRAWVLTQIANLVASSPGALDTLNELAAALGNDPNFSTTILAAIAAKVVSGAYGSGWNNDTTHAPSRDDVYDKIEALSGAYAPIPVVNTAAALAASNLTYAAGRLIIESDTGVSKYGDGVTAYASLPTVDTAGKVLLEATFSATTGNYTTLADLSEMGTLIIPDLNFAVDLHFFSSAMYNDTAGGVALVSICKSDNTVLGSDRVIAPNWASPPTGLSSGRATTVWASLAAHSSGTYKVRLQRVGATGNAVIFADANSKARFRAIGR